MAYISRAEKERSKKHAEIIKMYLQEREAEPNAKPYRIFCAVSEKCGYTPSGVRLVLDKNNINYKL